MIRDADQQGELRLDGVRLGFRVEGAGRPALVLGSSVYYPRTFSRRLRQYLRLAFVDVRHFAEIDDGQGADGVSLQTYLDDIDRVRARLGIERAVIIGHSHHGNLAVEYARRHPDRATHLVLIGSPPVAVSQVLAAAETYWNENASEQRKAVLQSQVDALDTTAMTPGEAFVARHVAEGPRYWCDPAFDATPLWRGMPIHMDLIGVFRSFFADRYRMAWDAAQLSAPVLAITGRHDYAVPPTLWDDRPAAIRHLHYARFEYSGHTPQLEEPERFDHTLLDWLAGR